MLLAPTLAPSVLHSEKQRGKKRKEKEKKKEGKKKGRKKGEKRRKREEFATPELEINHPVIRVFSAFSALSLFAINAHAEMHPGTARISRDCFSSFNRREKFAVSTREYEYVINFHFVGGRIEERDLDVGRGKGTRRGEG